jgi:hypothetical protein
MTRNLGPWILWLAITVCISLAETSTFEGYAQTARRESQPRSAEPQDNYSNILLPRYRQLSNPHPPNIISADPGSWLLYLRRSGGLDGTMHSSIQITSDGDISIIATAPADGCRRHLPDKLDELTAAIRLALLHESTWIDASANVSLCNDCYRTTLEIYYRGEDGLVSGYATYWDDTTVASLVKEISDIYRTTQRLRDSALGGCKKPY